MSGVRIEENVIVFIIFFQKRIKATNTDNKTSQTIKKWRLQNTNICTLWCKCRQKMHRP